MVAPVSVLTVCDICFRAIADNVVQPDLSGSGTVAVTNKLPTVSVYIRINSKWSLKQVFYAPKMR